MKIYVVRKRMKKRRPYVARTYKRRRKKNKNKNKKKKKKMMRGGDACTL